MSKTNRTDKSVRFALLNAVALAGLMASPALAQDASTETVSEEEIVITGYRASLRSSTEAKRNSVSFTDSVFAEDIGQMPDLNIAESLNRIPGIQLAREVNGEGLQVAIRGLDTNFTKIVLNSTQIAVASTGSADSQGVNRELDLDIFPTELFTRLDVSKTQRASQLEGGAAGLVNMRSARPFDYADSQITYTVQGSYAEQNEEWSPRAAIIASGRWETGAGEFGVLAGYAGVRSKSTTFGYETIGVTNANMTYNHVGIDPPFIPATATTPSSPITPATNPCGSVVQPTQAELDDGTFVRNTAPLPSAAQCFNGTGGNGFTWASTIPNVGGPPGYAPGTVITDDILLDLNPGATLAQIGEGLLPRLGRPAYFDGDRDRDAAMLSLQWAPNDNIEFYLDIVGAQAERNFNRIDLMFEVRSFNSMIPLEMEVDENNVVTYGRFANSRLFLEARPYTEELEFYNINPGARINVNEHMRFDVQANKSRSTFFRAQPTVGLGLTPVEVEYINEGGDTPVFNYAVDPNDPDAGWTWVRAFLQAEERVTETEGLHVDFTWGEERQNIRVGAAWDNISREIRGLDNVRAWQNFTCGGNADLTVNATCNGAPGSAIETAEISQFLTPSPAGFVTPLYDQIFAATNYHEFLRTASLCPLTPCTGVAGAATGARSGDIDEGTLGGYIEVNAESEFLDRTLRYNLGVRYIHTDQTISAPNAIQGEIVFISLDSEYDEYLPSFNAAFDLTENIVLRMAASRTLTRANPNDMLPATTFSDPCACVANQGNPDLTPFLSTNFDFGGEWYTGGEGYVGVALFNKRLTGFTETGTRTVVFSELGIPFDSLVQAQQAAITGAGGPDVAPVVVNTRVNRRDPLTVKGYEINWVQPLTFILDGLGFTANYTRLSGSPTLPTNVSPVTYNFTGYYEVGGFSGRVSYTWNDEQRQTDTPQDNFNNSAQPQAGHRFNEARGQLDAAFRYTFDFIPSDPQLTLDLININGATRREYQGYNNMAYKFYDPGYSVLLGIRGTF
jgi:TonB-dependent receptor